MFIFLIVRHAECPSEPFEHNHRISVLGVLFGNLRPEEVYHGDLHAKHQVYDSLVYVTEVCDQGFHNQNIVTLIAISNSASSAAGIRIFHSNLSS